MISSMRLRPGIPSVLVAVLLPLVVSLALVPLRGTVNLVTHSLVLLVSVVASALVGGLTAGLVAAVWATVLLNFLFTPPFHTFRVTDPNNIVALVVFALVAAIVSWAVDQSTRREHEAVRAATLEAADRVRSALLAAVGHDLRTPLATAKASITGLLSEDVDMSREDRRELLEGADASVDRLSSLVNNLLDLSRVQAGAMPVVLRPTALEDVVARALDDLGPRDRLVRVDVPPDLPEVNADAALLQRSVANLVANALRFSPPECPPAVTAWHGNGRVDLSVIDHGPGIPETDRDNVFRPFQRLGDTSNNEGLGLGLAVARGLVEAMHGTVTPAQTEGGGLTMIVSLEAAP